VQIPPPQLRQPRLELPDQPDGIPEWIPPAWIDRTRTPLINTRIHGTLTARKHARNRHPSRT
jgi:hypothetical protein